MTHAELRLECLKLVVEHHEKELPTPKQRLEFAEKLFEYLTTGKIDV